MNSGLYTRPGVSATASVAAWANLFPAPMTNVSNVYLALKDLGVRAFRTDSAPSAAAPFPVLLPGPPTLTTREVSWPTTSSSASSSSGLKRLSMYSLAKVLGTEISSWSSWRATGRMPSNQTLKDETSMCSEARSKTSVQTCSALPTMLLDPGVDDGLDQIPAERGDEALARLVGHDETMLFQDRQVPVSGAHAYLQPISHRRGTNLTALQDRDEHLLLPLGDVHPRHTVRVSSLRGRRRNLSFLDHSLVCVRGDGGHGAATDVVLDGNRPTDLLGLRACDAKPGSDAPDLTERLGRGAGKAELHRPALVLHPRSFIRNAHDVTV